MRILAIETSCDDTGIAVLEIKNNKFKTLANVVSSQTIHQNYGGVFPMMAKREHQRNLLPVLEKSLRESKLLNPKHEIRNPKQIEIIKEILKKEPELFDATIKFLETHQKPKVDFIAVTNGPGLEPCLWVGVNFAKVLSYIWDIPVIAVNHIEAHILVNFLNHKSYLINPKEVFPAIALIVSGGHTQLILVKGIGKYEIIGETRDDAAGECFDKCARVLGLGYPGGPIISKIASKIKESNITLPRPMINSQDYDFSFSGLKTAVLYADQKVKDKTKTYIQNMCFEIQQSIIEVLIKKTFSAVKNFGAKTIILGGGVSANQELREQFKLQASRFKNQVIFPETKLSTDNGLMIAVTGYYKMKQPHLAKASRGKVKKIAGSRLQNNRGSAILSGQNLSADANLRVGAKN